MRKGISFKLDAKIDALGEALAALAKSDTRFVVEHLPPSVLLRDPAVLRAYADVVEAERAHWARPSLAVDCDEARALYRGRNDRTPSGSDDSGSVRLFKGMSSSRTDGSYACPGPRRLAPRSWRAALPRASAPVRVGGAAGLSDVVGSGICVAHDVNLEPKWLTSDRKTVSGPDSNALSEVPVPDEKLLDRQRQYLTTLHDAGLLDDEAFAAYLTATGSPYSRPSVTQWRNGKTPMPGGAMLLLDGYHASRGELIAAANLRMSGRAVRVVSDVVELPTGKTAQQEGIEAVDAIVASLTSLALADRAVVEAKVAHAEQQLAEFKASLVAL